MFSNLTFIFVIIVAILMSIGLAVGDIDRIRMNAIAEKRTIKVGIYS